MGEDQKLDRRQAEQVLGRAASLALQAPDERISVAELEAAAQEAGLDRALVRRAASELGVEQAEPRRRYGMETRLVRRRLLPRRLRDADFARLMARLDAFFGAHGDRDVGGESASWHARHVQVTFEPHTDGTLVQVSERFVNTARSLGSVGLSFGATLGLLFGVVGFSSLTGLAGAAVVALLVVAFGWLGLSIVRRRHAAVLARTGHDFERALDSVEQTAKSDDAPALRDGVTTP